MIELLAAAQAGIGAALLGMVPVFVWLGFWLSEDWVHPEPRGRLVAAFLTGMLAVVLVLPFQKLASDLMPLGLPLLFTWAAVEEVAKFALAYAIVLRGRAVDEPLDQVVYLITVALGFAALENTLFLISPFMEHAVLEGAMTANLRFIGATLIHVLSSAIIGAALALSFFRSRGERVRFAVLGIILATALHTLFNFLIIATGADTILTVFLGVWVGIVTLLLVLERIKRMRPPAWWERIRLL